MGFNTLANASDEVMMLVALEGVLNLRGIAGDDILKGAPVKLDTGKYEQTASNEGELMVGYAFQAASEDDEFTVMHGAWQAAAYNEGGVTEGDLVVFDATASATNGVITFSTAASGDYAIGRALETKLTGVQTKILLFATPVVAP